MIHDDSELSNIRRLIVEFSKKTIQEIDIKVTETSQRAEVTRRALKPKYQELSIIIIEASLGLNYMIRASNYMADMLLCTITLDGKEATVLQSIRKYLMDSYAKQPEDPKIIDEMMNTLANKITGSLKGKSLNDFHEVFKEFIKALLERVIKKNEPRNVVNQEVMQEMLTSRNQGVEGFGVNSGGNNFQGGHGMDVSNGNHSSGIVGIG